MTQLMKEKLMEAIEAKQNDVRNFIWKYARKHDGTQDEIRLMDATPEQLQQFYNHCYSMLYSEDKVNPGRYVLLDIIREQRDKCNVELYLRKLAEGAFTGGEGISKYAYCQNILDCIKKNKQHFPQSELKNIPITAVTGGVPKEFSRLSIDEVLSGCLDTLGVLNTKHITFSFIKNLGIYLTPEEMKDLIERDENGAIRSRLEVIKERLNINPSVMLSVKPSGLSYAEFRSMLNLRSKKYAELTIPQLTTLRNKVLFCLEREVTHHASQWEDKIHQLELVATAKGITLERC